MIDIKIKKKKIIAASFGVAFLSFLTYMGANTEVLAEQTQIVDSQLNTAKYLSYNDYNIESEELDLNTTKYYNYISGDTVKLFNDNKDDSEIIEYLNKGDFVSVYTDKTNDTNGWLYVSHYDNYGYIHSEFATDEFIYNADAGTVYIKEDCLAYIQPSLNCTETISLKFNDKIKQLYSNEQWAICSIDDTFYFIPRSKVSSNVCFKEKNQMMYVKTENAEIYTTPDEIFKTNLNFVYDDAVYILKANNDWAAFYYNDKEYFIKTSNLSEFKDLSDEKADYFNENYYNTEMINRLNSYYDESVIEDFKINNDKLDKLSDEYIAEAKEKAGPDATPAEIVYYCYIELMDNAVYRYNTYYSKVKNKYGITSNTGAYRAASILDKDIACGACENYAAAMTIFLRKNGFPAEVVGGDGGGSGSSGHYWCQVGDLVFDAQIDDSRKTYGFRYGRTSDEFVESGSAGYYVEETVDNDEAVYKYNQF